MSEDRNKIGQKVGQNDDASSGETSRPRKWNNFQERKKNSLSKKVELPGANIEGKVFFERSDGGDLKIPKCKLAGLLGFQDLWWIQKSVFFRLKDWAKINSERQQPIGVQDSKMGNKQRFFQVYQVEIARWG